MLTVVPGDGSGLEGGKDSSLSLIDEIVREGARRMLAGALQAGVDAYIARFADERDGAGQRAVAQRDLPHVDYACLWAGGIDVNIRPGEHRLCLLVMIGVLAGGRKELIALAGGYREPAEARAEIWGAGDKQHALDAVTAFKAACGAKVPQAAAKITGGLGQLLAFCDYPCEHWVHLRTRAPGWRGECPSSWSGEGRDEPTGFRDRGSRRRTRWSPAGGPPARRRRPPPDDAVAGRQRPHPGRPRSGQRDPGH